MSAGRHWDAHDHDVGCVGSKLPAFGQGVPRVGGIRQRLGLPSRILREAPGPLVLKVDMMLGKAMLTQVRMNLGGVCLGSTWKMKLLPLWHEKSVTRQVVLGQWELQIWANVELLASG